MFPFKTKHFSYKSRLAKQEVLKRLNVLSDNYYYKKNWKSSVNNDTVTCELKINYRNSFRPIIVAELLSDPDGTLYVSGYYKTADIVAYPTLLIVFFGLYNAFKIGSILPLFASFMIWAIFVLGMGYMFFKKEYEKIKNEFEEAIGVSRFSTFK